MSVEALRVELRAVIAKAGNAATWARAHGVSESYAGEVLNRGKEPGRKLLTAMRWRRVVTYEPIPPGERM